MRSETCLGMICLPLHHTETDGLRALFRLRGFFGPSSHELAGGDFRVVLNHSENFLLSNFDLNSDGVWLMIMQRCEENDPLVVAWAGQNPSLGPFFHLHDQ